ncbi:hypothetical protein GCM10008019_41040 [Deinococcus soli (ex Cha et al. 2016)]|nr:hypothetical protein GCM10008019_41040 [Deinococcus soli (ex Cha et al. 2016)]
MTLGASTTAGAMGAGMVVTGGLVGTLDVGGSVERLGATGLGAAGLVGMAGLGVAVLGAPVLGAAAGDVRRCSRNAAPAVPAPRTPSSSARDTAVRISSPARKGR